MFRLNSYFGTKVVSLERVGGLAIELYRVAFFATIVFTIRNWFASSLF